MSWSNATLLDEFASFEMTPESHRTSVVSSSLFGFEIVSSVPTIRITCEEPTLLMLHNDKEVELLIETNADSIVEGHLELSTADDYLKIKKRRIGVGKCGANTVNKFRFPVSLKKSPGGLLFGA